MGGKEYWRKSLVLRPAEVTETFRIEQDGISGMSRWKGTTKRHPTTRWRSKCVTHNDVVSLENILKLPFVCQNMKPQERFDYHENFYGFSSVFLIKNIQIKMQTNLSKKRSGLPMSSLFKLWTMWLISCRNKWSLKWNVLWPHACRAKKTYRYNFKR